MSNAQKTPTRPKNLPPAKWIWIDPCKAAKYLEKNIRNRPVSPKRVKGYSNIMLSDGWVRNGETLKVDTNGYILDGQQRLMAIIDSAKSQWMLVVSKIEPKAFDTIDVGRTRTLSQLLAANGAEHASILTGMTSLVLNYDANREPYNSTSNLPGYATPHERIQYYLDNKAILDATVSYIVSHRTATTGVTRRILAFFYHVIARTDYDDAQKFMSAFLGDLSIDIPVAHKLRDMMVVNAMHSSRQMKMSQKTQLALFMKAWNAFRNNNSCPKVLNFKETGVGMEKFPRAK